MIPLLRRLVFFLRRGRFEAELEEGKAPRLFIVEPGGEVRSLTAAGTSATLSALVESPAPN